MSIGLSVQSFVVGAVCMALAVAIALLVAEQRARKATRLKRKIPLRWPLSPRTIANTRERIVWVWMCQTFDDHAVMVKMPVTRFMFPTTPEQGQTWYQLLTNAYCTFTVVDAGGRVIGCVDVTDPSTYDKRSQNLKRSLLSTCGIGYAVVDSTFLPEGAKIRAEFIGAQDQHRRSSATRRTAAATEASDQLRSSLHKQRQTRTTGPAPLSSDADSESELPSHLSTGSGQLGYSWQKNSFLMPIDSRKIDLG